MRKGSLCILIICLLCSGCTVIKTTGDIIGAAGKVVYAVGKVTVETIKTTGKVIGAAGSAAGSAISYFSGKKVIKLTRQGNSLFVQVLLNRKVEAMMMVDTGCADSLISPAIAQKLDIAPEEGTVIQCSLAGGYSATGRAVNIKEIRLGGVKVSNVTAIVLDSAPFGDGDGLLGMGFLNNFVFKIDSQKEELILERRT